MALTLPSIDLNANTVLKDFVGEVRDHLRDYAQLNRLIEGEETSDRMIAFSILQVVDKFTTLPPLIGTFRIETFPSRFLLLEGTVAQVLRSAALLQARNQLDYQAGGVAVAHSNKAPLYLSFVQMMESEWHQMAKGLKVALNIERAYGHSVSSEYLFLNGFFGDF